MEMKDFVTVDLDYPSRRSVLNTYYTLNKLCGNVEFRRSCSKGLHFRAKKENSTFPERYYIRFMAGDDYNRLYMDYQRWRMEKYDVEVLWDKKGNKEVGEWMSGDRNLLNLLDSMDLEIQRRRDNA